MIRCNSHIDALRSCRLSCVCVPLEDVAVAHLSMKNMASEMARLDNAVANTSAGESGSAIAKAQERLRRILNGVPKEQPSVPR